MSLKDAQAFAFSLATTLMVAIIIFRAGDGSLSVVPTCQEPPWNENMKIISDLAINSENIVLGHSHY